ncbi:MAG: hypothetical protein M0P33_08565 [Massilibacteroides sp.]|nr:hypothetical protein [Massilibacteroides sp.]
MNKLSCKYGFKLICILLLLGSFASCSDKDDKTIRVSELSGVWSTPTSTKDSVPTLSIQSSLGESTMSNTLMSLITSELTKQMANINVIRLKFDEPAGYKFSFEWKENENDKAQVYPDILALNYKEDSSTLYILINEDLINILAVVLKERDTVLPIEQIKGMLVKIDGNYTLPIQMKQDGDLRTFYLTKDVTLPLLNLFVPLVKSSLPETVLAMLPQLMEAVSATDYFDIGLRFKKEESIE